MPTLDHFPTNDEAAAHASAYPYPLMAGFHVPKMAGVWFLRARHGAVQMLFVAPGDHGEPEVYEYDNNQGVFSGGILEGDTVLAVALDPMTGRAV